MAVSYATRAWRERISIPTYGIGDPDRNPMFLEKRVYQGSSGVVYPLPVIDRVLDEKEERSYEAVFLENQYLKIMILPELGGRVQMALDKTNDYHFVYYNRVIKPALVGLAGPWISGGIEFNWPQHHRPSTFMPVDHEIVENEDGSWTVWCSEIDRMHGTKGMHGFTLHPGKAYLEVKARLFNRTSLPQTFLWWANPAIHVDETHQSIFPTDVNAVMDHGKRDVSEFPIAKGEYYKVDYSPGTDVSRYRNIPVPTSYMAHRSEYNFVGSYDHGKQAGLLHIANHHVSPGKKQWTWGNGEFGYAWDRELTDEDGPYIELMCGAFTDNQPDFSWLMPGEEKSFSQFFMPYKGVGLIKNATVDAAVGLDLQDNLAVLRVYTTSEQEACRVTVHQNERVVLEETFDSSPRSWFETQFAIDAARGTAGCKVLVVDRSGRHLVSWASDEVKDHVIPEPAQAIEPPGKVDSVESLYLAGTHLEQYRHATREPDDYYREGLRRDSGDIRCNNARGRLLLRRGRFAKAERHFRVAIERLTRHNPNPYDGEAHYNLGLARKMQERFDEAQDAFWKATWNASWQEASFFELARLAIRRGDLSEASEMLDRCLTRNTRHHQAMHLKVFVLSKTGDVADAWQVCDAELQRDPFNLGVLYEQAVLSGDFRTFESRIRDDEHNYLELAFDYAHAGAYERADDVLSKYLARAEQRPRSPMTFYHLADFRRRLCRNEEAVSLLSEAATCSPDWCFPNRLDDIQVLSWATDTHAGDARAPYYLGNLWYDRRQHDEAIRCWEESCRRNPEFPTTWRNLGIAYFNKHGDAEKAWDALGRAFALDTTDARVLYELDQLAKRLGHAPEQRLARLHEHRQLVDIRDDLYLEWVTLLNRLGQHSDALDAILSHRFHPWEGGEGKVPGQYVLALTQLAWQAITDGRCQEALELLERSQIWPESLGEGKLAGNRENDVHYLKGIAFQESGDADSARASFERATGGQCELTSAMYYNDQPPEMFFYQALAQQALGNEEEARGRFRQLLEYGRAHLDDEVTIDYFAVSLPDFLVFEEDLNRRNRIHCHFMTGLGLHGLGLLGLGQHDEATRELDTVLDLDGAHQGAVICRHISAPARHHA